MIIEQRNAPRKTVATDVLVNADHLDQSIPRLWKTHDLSLTGAFVEMQGAGLNVGDSIEAVLMLHHQHRDEPHCVTARITRVTPRGIGLEFGHCEKRTRDVLTKMIESHELTPAP